MRKVGVRAENYPLTKKNCPLDEVLRLDSGLAQANFGHVPGGRVGARDGHAHTQERTRMDVRSPNPSSFWILVKN